MSTYPEHVTTSARKAAEWFYQRLPHIDVPGGYDLDDLVELPADRTDFAQAAAAERRSE